MSKHEHIPEDLQELYEIHDYRHAAAILACEFPDESEEVFTALRSFRYTKDQLLKSGGNESDIPKAFSSSLRPLGWKEAQLKAKHLVDDEEVTSDTHKIDYIKNKIAFDLEWNSKDQTFDRDLYAFRAFFEYHRISVGILVTRSQELDPFFKQLGIFAKYGASTTHLGKLLPRLQAGRSGGCPVLVFGITTKLLR
ncbi:MAG: BglII/BstYI family type II restriction endonuclease [Blastocatellales bacterium]